MAKEELRHPELLTAKLIDLDTVVDKRPEITTSGPVLWATVRLQYALDSTCPKVSIRVPLPWSDSADQSESKDLALRLAKKLIDQACESMPEPGPA